MALLPMAKAMQPSRGSVMSGVASAAPGPLEAQPLGGLSNLSLPLNCPLHEGGKGWTITDPCLACIALAMGDEPVRPFPACDPGNTPGEASLPCSPPALNEALIASDSMTGTGLQEGGGFCPWVVGGFSPQRPSIPSLSCGLRSPQDRERVEPQQSLPGLFRPSNESRPLRVRLYYMQALAL